MKLINLFVLGINLIYLVLPVKANPIIIAQNSCPEEELYSNQEASKITRRVQLPKFGIEISVPQNYRVMLKNNGQVQILHPQDYALWQCIIEHRGYGRGYYSENITLIPRNTQLSLSEQIKRDYSQSEIIPYSNGLLSGYILINKEGLILPEFIGIHPTRNAQLLNIYTNCDCDVETQDFINFLSSLNISILN